MLLSLVALSLAAAPVKTLAAPGLACTNVDAKVGNSFLEHFAQQLAAQGSFEVTTPQQVQTILGLERQKQLLDCGDDSCSTEIAAALGVDAVITGTITKTSGGYLINLRIFRSADAKALAVFTSRPKTDEEVLDFLEDSAKRFAASYGVKNSELVVGNTGAPPVNALPWIAGGAAVAAGVTAAVMLALAQGTADRVRAGDAASPDELGKLRSTGQTQETVGYVLVGVAGALAATTVALALVGSPREGVSSVSVVPLREGGAVVVGGSF